MYAQICWKIQLIYIYSKLPFSRDLCWFFGHSVTVRTCSTKYVYRAETTVCVVQMSSENNVGMYAPLYILCVCYV